MGETLTVKKCEEYGIKAVSQKRFQKGHAKNCPNTKIEK